MIQLQVLNRIVNACLYPKKKKNQLQRINNIETIKFTLKAICSRKWAVPLVAEVSPLEPESIQTPTVALFVSFCSVATVKPVKTNKPINLFFN